MAKPKDTETYKKVCEYINAHDVFWLNVLRQDLGYSSETKDSCVGTVIGKLKDLGYIQCCDIKGTTRQYILIKPIDVNEI